MILMTGGSGFLGRQILGRLLVEHPEKEFCLLARTLLKNLHSNALKLSFEKLFEDEEKAKHMSKRVSTIESDITLDNFGIEDERYKALTETVSSVLHCAATTHLNESQEISDKVNVGGTKNVLSFSDQASSHFDQDFSLHHVSTAYVAGDVERIIMPHELELDVKFRNSYERSKAVSESLVRQHADNFRCVIYRPSIIVGDSVTGETSAFNVMYIPLKLLVRGFFLGVPARPHIPFDVVPVDYVADAITEIFSQGEIPSGSCFHLSSGVGRESTPRELIEIVAQTLIHCGEKKLYMPSFVSPVMLNRAISSFCAAAERLRILETVISKRLGVAQQIMPFVPYMVRNPQFHTGTTEDVLRICPSRPPLFKHYADRIISYCLETNWGRIPWSNPRNLSNWANRVNQPLLTTP